MTLRDELRDDPLARGYAKMIDKEALASLTARDRDVFRDVAISQLAGVIEEQALVPALRAVPEASPIYPVAEQLLRFTTGQTPVTSITYTNPAIRQRTDIGIGGLVQTGVITQVQADLIFGLGRATVSRAEELGLGQINERDIKEAR